MPYPCTKLPCCHLAPRGHCPALKEPPEHALTLTVAVGPQKALATDTATPLIPHAAEHALVSAHGKTTDSMLTGHKSTPAGHSI
mmetsp:Transcript_58736/g.171898  ORF Transcript_58736/g.171898 Transcript_58736/m.171898 type:complete len:84 (-) Transcript_58736:428-679(-)